MGKAGPQVLHRGDSHTAMCESGKDIKLDQVRKNTITILACCVCYSIYLTMTNNTKLTDAEQSIPPNSLLAM